MFGLFRSRSERLARRVERHFVKMETAANRGEWELAARASQQKDRALRDFATSAGWSEEQLHDWLNSRGHVRSLRDPEYAKWLSENMPSHFA